LIIEQPTRSLDVAKRNRGITVGSQTGHSAARIFGLKDGQGLTVAHLKTRATRGNLPERYSVKMALIELLADKGWSAERINHLLKALDDMLYLPPELNEKLWYEITEHKQETVMNYLATLEYQAMEKGRMIGAVEGRQEGRQEG